MALALASGASVCVFDELDSTSAEARRRMEAGAAPSFWVLARRQTAGYGRRGAAWRHAEGDFAGTLATSAGTTPDRLGEWSFVVALAALDAVRRFAPGAALSLKWPNDLLAGGAKLSGLLLEYVAAPPRAADLAIGVGVNVVSRPDVAEYPTARLLDLVDGAPPTPDAFLVALDAALHDVRSQWRQEGFAPVRARWLANAEGLGRSIRVRTPDDVIDGVFEDLDPTGALILDCAGGRRVIAAGAIIRT